MRYRFLFILQMPSFTFPLIERMEEKDIQPCEFDGSISLWMRLNIPFLNQGQGAPLIFTLAFTEREAALRAGTAMLPMFVAACTKLEALVWPSADCAVDLGRQLDNWVQSFCVSRGAEVDKDFSVLPFEEKKDNFHDVDQVFPCVYGGYVPTFALFLDRPNKGSSPHSYYSLEAPLAPRLMNSFSQVYFSLKFDLSTHYLNENGEHFGCITYSLCSGQVHHLLRPQLMSSCKSHAHTFARDWSISDCIANIEMQVVISYFVQIL